MKQRKANMAKKQVLMKKMQAVRMGAGDQIMASKCRRRLMEVMLSKRWNMKFETRNK